MHNGQAIGQSLAIIDYLDQIHPTPRLFPTDALKRARVWQACEIINSGTQPLHNTSVLKELTKTFHASDAQKAAWTVDSIHKGLEALEAFLKPHAGRYSFGDTLTAADCVLIPQLASADRFHADLGAYPTLRKIRVACEELEAFRKAHPRAQPDTPKDF